MDNQGENGPGTTAIRDTVSTYHLEHNMEIKRTILESISVHLSETEALGLCYS